jgi:Phage integrase, N-terminal SAM-like domain
MGALRTKMIEEMRLRNFAARTQKSYLAVMVGLAKHYRQFPDQLTQEQIRTYLLHRQSGGRGIKRVGLNRVVVGKRGYGDLKAREQRKVWRLVADEMASR